MNQLKLFFERHRWAGLLLIFALFFFLTYWRALRMVNMGMMDIDCIVDRSFRVYSGQLPYRDFFVPTMPLSYIVQSMFWKIFGPSAASMKLYLAGINSAAAVLLFLFLNGVLRARTWTTAVCMALFLAWSPFSIFPVPWFNSDSSMAALLALLCLTLYAQKGKAGFAFLGGAFCGLSFLFKQNDGAGAILAGGLFVLGSSLQHRDKKPVGLFALGAALPIASCLAYFGANGALHDFIDWTIVRAAKGKVGQNPVYFLLGPLRTLFGPVCKFLRVIFFVYLAAWLALEFRLRKEPSAEFKERALLYRRMLLFSFIFSYFAYLSFAGINYAFYQIFIWVPFLVLFEALHSRIFRFGLAALAFGFVMNSLRITLWKHRAFHEPEMKIDYAFQTERFRGAYYYAAAGRPMDQLAEYLKANMPADENVLIFPEPLSIYFAIDRLSPNPVSAYGETDYEMLPEDQEEVLSAMRGKNVRWAVLQIPFPHHFSQHAKYGKLMDFIIEHFEWEEMFYPFVVLYRPNEEYRSSGASKQRVMEELEKSGFTSWSGADI